MSRGRFARTRFVHALGAFGAAGTGLVPAVARAETYTLRLNVATSPDSIFVLSGVKFAQAVKRRTNGQLNIEVYHSGQLATQQGSIDQMISGALDLTIQPSVLMIPLAAQWQILDLPFLFPGLDQAYRVLDGAIGDELFAALEPRGIIGLGWITSNFKQLETTTKAVSVPDDLKGLRIRIVPSAVMTATYRTLGAIPTNIDIGELYIALQQHTVDGMDLSLDAFTAAKWDTVTKHVARTNHVLSVVPLFGSKKRIESLPVALQKIVKEEGRTVVRYERSLSSQRDADAIAQLKRDGIAFTDVQHNVFRRVVDPVYQMVQQRLGGDIVERINRAANGGRG